MTMMLLVLAAGLFLWTLMRAYRRAIKQTVAMAVAHGELFGPAGTTPGVAVEPSEADRRPASDTEKRTDPGKNPRDILELQRCPQCNYSLEGLPRRHRCPECGFEYDESMFTLAGWGRDHERSTSGTATAAAGGVLDWMAGRFTFSSAGVVRGRITDPLGFIPWKQFRTFGMWRVGRDSWHFRLRPGFWAAMVHTGGRRARWGCPTIEGVIECTNAEAASIDDEIRRRLRASQEQ